MNHFYERAEYENYLWIWVDGSIYNPVYISKNIKRSYMKKKEKNTVVRELHTKIRFRGESDQ
jgi:hypothetical protein